jgi:hypothetical protein
MKSIFFLVIFSLCTATVEAIAQPQSFDASKMSCKPETGSPSVDYLFNSEAIYSYHARYGLGSADTYIGCGRSIALARLNNVPVQVDVKTGSINPGLADNGKSIVSFTGKWDQFRCGTSELDGRSFLYFDDLPVAEAPDNCSAVLDLTKQSDGTVQSDIHFQYDGNVVVQYDKLRFDVTLSLEQKCLIGSRGFSLQEFVSLDCNE